MGHRLGLSFVVGAVTAAVVAAGLTGVVAPASASAPVPAVDTPPAVPGGRANGPVATTPMESVGPIPVSAPGTGRVFPEGPTEVAVMPDGGVSSGVRPFLAVPGLMGAPSDVAVRVVDAALPGPVNGSVVWSGRLRDGWAQIDAGLPAGGAYRVDVSADDKTWDGVGWFVVRGAWAPGGNDVGTGALSVSQVSGGVSWGWASAAPPGPLGAGAISLGWTSGWAVPTSLRAALPRGLPAGWRMGVGSGSPWAGVLVSTTDGIARVVGWDGAVLVFQRNGSGVWAQVTGGAPGFSNELRSVDANTWEFISAEGATTRFTGAAGTFRASKVFSGGHLVSEVAWDAEQRIKKVTNEVGRSIVLAYADAAGACASQGWTEFGWAAVPDGQLCAITYPDGSSTSIGYVAGVGGGTQIGTVQDPGRVATTLGWGARGRLVSERGPFANRVALTDPAAKDEVTRLTYDAAGRAVALKVGPGPTQRLTFPAVTEEALKAWVKDPDKAAKDAPVTFTASVQATGFDLKQTSYLDPTAWVTVRALDSSGGSMTMEADDQGRVNRQVDSLGRVTTYEYNDLGLVIKTTGPTRSTGAPKTAQDFDTRTERGKQVDLVGMRALVGVGANRVPEFWPATPSRGGLSYSWQGRPAGWAGQATAVWTPSKAEEDAAKAAGGWRFQVTSEGADATFRVGAKRCQIDQAGICEMGELPRGVKQVTVEISRGQARGWFAVLAGPRGGRVALVDSTEIAPGYGLQTEASNNDVFPGRTADPKTVVSFANPALGRPTSVTSAGGLTSTYQYEPDGWQRVLAVSTAGGATQRTSYWPDAGSATLPTVCGGGQVNVSGQIKSVTRQDGSVMTWWPDISGRVVATQLAGRDGQTQTGCTSYFADGTVKKARTFDSSGQLVETTTSEPAVNGDYRVSRTTISKGPGAPAGRLTEVWTQARSNNTGQLVEQTGSSGVTTTSTYNALGLPLTSTTSVPGGAPLTMTYGYRAKDAQVSSVTVNGVKAAEVTYDSFGRVTSVAYPGGVVQTYSYDTQGRPSATTVRAGEAAWTHAIRRTDFGRILSETLQTGAVTETRSYTYDPGTGRLTKAAISAGDIATNYEYSFGPQDASCPGAGSYVPGKDGLRSGGARDGTAYITCHDSSGRVTSTTDPLVTGGSGTSNVTHDAFGRVTSISGANPVTIDWAQGSAMSRLAQGGDDSMVLDMENFGGTTIVRTVTTAEGSQTARFAGPFTFAVDESGMPTGIIATQYALPGSAQITIQDGTATATLADVSGAAMATISLPALAGGTGAGDLVAAPRFGPYGEPLATATWKSPVKDYTWRSGAGLETLPGSASVTIMGARAYHPGLGEFLTTDPKIDGGDALYAFTSGDPINFRDPSGGSEEASWTPWLAAIGGGILALVAGGAAWKAGVATTVGGAKAATWIAGVAGAAAAGVGSYLAVKAAADSDSSLMAAGIAIAAVGGLSAAVGIFRGVRNVKSLRSPDGGPLVLHSQQVAPELDGEYVSMFANVDDPAMADRIFRREALKVHPDKVGGSDVAFGKLKDAFDDRMGKLTGNSGKLYDGVIFMNDEYFTGPARVSGPVPEVAPVNPNRYSNGSNLSMGSLDPYGGDFLGDMRRNAQGF